MSKTAYKKSFLWWILWLLNWLYCKLFFRFEIIDKHNLPPSNQQPLIIVSNHRSYADPPILAALTKNNLSFMVAREYYNLPFLNWLCNFLQCIPVTRSGKDTGAIRQALKMLQNGHWLAIFPEGGIRREDLPSTTTFNNEVKQGSVLLAERTGAAILPIGMYGAPMKESMLATLFPPAKVFICIGSVFTIPALKDKALRENHYALYTQKIITIINQLTEEARKKLIKED